MYIQLGNTENLSISIMLMNGVAVGGDWLATLKAGAADTDRWHLECWAVAIHPDPLIG